MLRQMTSGKVMICLLILSVLPLQAHATEFNLSVKTSKPTYHRLEEVLVYGNLTYGGWPVQHIQVTVTLLDPSQTTIDMHTTATNESGTYQTTFTLGPTAPLGTYTVRASSNPYGRLTINTTAFELVLNGPIRIMADGSVDPPIAPVQRNGNLYELTENFTTSTDGIVIERDNIILDGLSHTIQGAGTSSAKGVCLSARFNVTIQNLKIQAFYSGICLNSSSSTILQNCTTQNTHYGICLLASSNSTVTGNTVADSDYGISLSSSSNNTFCRNSVENNEVGIGLNESSNNMFYHNNLRSNLQQAQIEADFSTGHWDNGYPSGGNHWTDYAGNDENCDGIGDAPYTISDYNVDEHPLIAPWMPPDVVVTNITQSRAVIGQGFTSSMRIAVSNQGNKVEAISVSIHANATFAWSQFLTLNGGTSTTIEFSWNTTGWAKGSYAIAATANVVEPEPSTPSSIFVGGAIKVVTPGDVNADGYVGIFDIYMIAAHFSQEPEHPAWDGTYDINDDSIVDIMDIFTAASHFGMQESRMSGFSGIILKG